MNTKAQAEIFGLIVIVLIISMVMMIYLSSEADRVEDQQGISTQKKYAYNELAISYLDSLVDTSVCSVQLDVLIRDCGSQQQIRCSDGKTSCQKLNETIIQIKNETLDEWGLPYGLIIDFPEYAVDDLEYVKNNCTKETTGRSAPGWIPISLEPTGTAMLELGICEPEQ